MAGSAEQRRAWQGPALFSFGFRPFFLFGAAWSALAMAVWIASLAGWVSPPTRFSMVDWHAHEMLFGYLPAAIAGFLLTAVPNWTGRYPILGWPLVGLFALWLAGRIAIFFSAMLPTILVTVMDVGARGAKRWFGSCTSDLALRRSVFCSSLRRGLFLGPSIRALHSMRSWPVPSAS